jgi:hypothetical protein
MLFPTSKTLAVASMLLVLGACGSSSTDGAAVESFGVSVCSLGCNGGSFALNSHPANKDLSFTFNDKVDPTSVNLSSISIVNKATGASPTGSFIVNGARVIFRPTLVETSSGVQFGFLDGAVYQVRLFDDGSPNVVRAVSGRANESFITGDITITGVTDLVPGPPTMISITPDNITPPTGRDFGIEMVFDDVMSTLPMANPETGDSLLITVQSFDTTAGSIGIPGTFIAVVDRDALRTTVSFTPDVPWPSSNHGERQLRISLSQQISDLAGNTLSNPGIKTALLPDLPTVAGSLSETFSDSGQLDDNGSTAGLWATSGAPGTLDSGLDVTTGLHKGGGSGVLGSYILPDGLTTLDTDSMVITSELLGENVTVTNGMFPFSELVISQASRLEATGSNPARVIVRGRAFVEGVIDFSGASAPTNGNGKFFAHQEWDNGTSSSHGTFNESDLGKGEVGGLGLEDKALGTVGATGDLSAGGGGMGGQAWYYDSIRFVFGGGGDVYLNTSKLMWEQKFLGLPGEPDPSRFNRTKFGDEFNGGNGDGVGGVAATGSALAGSGNLMTDYQLGSGMGSWAWPPHSGNMPLANFTNGAPVLTHPTAFSGGSASAFGDFSLHRSRGGGGGGYWTNGDVGQYYDASSTNPTGAALVEPIVDLDGGDNIREFNGDGAGGNYFMWDAAAGGVIPDADGGHYSLPLNIHTADPEAGLLLGGSGGGGAGMSIHGSIFDRYNGTPGEIGTYRNCPGAGGGAGGGAAQIHVGSRLTIEGSILADGGDGGDSNFMLTVPFSDTNAIDFGPPGDAGGGGGSGGSLLIQVGSVLQAGLDSISVVGGNGGLGSAGNHGGDGGGGLVRVETGTGLESLSALQGMIAPDSAVELTPIGTPGQANIGQLAVNFSGGDVVAGDGTVFNGNASGVRSRWYEPSSTVQELVFDTWTVDYEWSPDGTTVNNGSFGNTAPTDPDTTPIWVGFQKGWMEAGQSALADPILINQSEWIIPGFNGVTDGIDELGGTIVRALRYMVVFDHDKIEALIGTGAGAYFRVTEINFEYTGD